MNCNILNTLIHDSMSSEQDVRKQAEIKIIESYDDINNLQIGIELLNSTEDRTVQKYCVIFMRHIIFHNLKRIPHNVIIPFLIELLRTILNPSYLFLAPLLFSIFEDYLNFCNQSQISNTFPEQIFLFIQQTSAFLTNDLFVDTISKSRFQILLELESLIFRLLPDQIYENQNNQLFFATLINQALSFDINTENFPILKAAIKLLFNYEERGCQEFVFPLLKKLIHVTEIILFSNEQSFINPILSLIEDFITQDVFDEEMKNDIMIIFLPYFFNSEISFLQRSIILDSLLYLIDFKTFDEKSKQIIHACIEINILLLQNNQASDLNFSIITNYLEKNSFQIVFLFINDCLSQLYNSTGITSIFQQAIVFFIYQEILQTSVENFQPYIDEMMLRIEEKMNFIYNNFHQNHNFDDESPTIILLESILDLVKCFPLDSYIKLFAPKIYSTILPLISFSSDTVKTKVFNTLSFLSNLVSRGQYGILDRIVSFFPLYPPDSIFFTSFCSVLSFGIENDISITDETIINLINFCNSFPNHFDDSSTVNAYLDLVTSLANHEKFQKNAQWDTIFKILISCLEPLQTLIQENIEPFQLSKDQKSLIHHALYFVSNIYFIDPIDSHSIISNIIHDLLIPAVVSENVSSQIRVTSFQVCANCIKCCTEASSILFDFAFDKLYQGERENIREIIFNGMYLILKYLNGEQHMKLFDLSTTTIISTKYSDIVQNHFSLISKVIKYKYLSDMTPIIGKTLDLIKLLIDGQLPFLEEKTVFESNHVTLVFLISFTSILDHLWSFINPQQIPLSITYIIDFLISFLEKNITIQEKLAPIIETINSAIILNLVSSEKIEHFFILFDQIVKNSSDPSVQQNVVEIFIKSIDNKSDIHSIFERQLISKMNIMFEWWKAAYKNINVLRDLADNLIVLFLKFLSIGGSLDHELINQLFNVLSNESCYCRNCLSALLEATKSLLDHNIFASQPVELSYLYAKGLHLFIHSSENNKVVHKISHEMILLATQYYKSIVQMNSAIECLLKEDNTS